MDRERAAHRASDPELEEGDARSHRFGDVRFPLRKVGRGHLHGTGSPTYRFQRDCVTNSCRKDAPDRTTFFPLRDGSPRSIRDAVDVDEVIAPFRVSYERVRARHKTSSS